MPDAPSSFSASNRLIAGPDDPILDPWLGKPLHGRTQEIKDLATLLAESHTDVQVVHTLVLAAGGVGKTELCKAALRYYLRGHPFKKAWFINLESATAMGDLWQGIGVAIGQPEVRSEAELLAALPEGIYYLDNLESLIDAPDLSRHLRALSQKPGIRLLASSRSEVPGWGKSFELKKLPVQAALDLFRETWGTEGVAPIPEHAPALETFVTQELDCLPLAIVLVAAQGRFEGTLEAVIQRWHAEGVALAQRPGAGTEERYDSLDRSILLSLQRLSAEARLLWGLAAFFPAGLPADFMTLCLQEQPALRQARDQLLLHRLVHRSSDEAAAQGRLRLSPPLARFARDHASKDEYGFEALAIFKRLGPWLKGLGNAADRDREGPAITRLFEEFPSMETTALFFVSLPSLPEGLMSMLKGWQNFFWRRIFLGKKILDAVLVNAKKLADSDHAWALETSGDISNLLDENAESRVRFDGALQLYEKVGSDLGKANTLQSLGELALKLGENAEGRVRFDAALLLYEKVGSDLGKASALKSLGNLAGLLGENVESRARFDAALPLYEKVGSDLGKAYTLQSLGDLALRLGENVESRARYDAALPLFEKVGDDLGKANTLRSLGDLALKQSEHAKCRASYHSALQFYEKVGSDLGKANTLKSLGDLARLLGENAESRARYDAALPLYEKVGSDLGKANTLLRLGDLALTLGEYAESRARYDAALPLFEKVGDDLGKANTLKSLGDLDKAEENPKKASEYWSKAILLYQKCGEPMGEGYCHVELARAAHQLGETNSAKAHLEQAKACSTRSGTPDLASKVAALEKELDSIT